MALSFTVKNIPRGLLKKIRERAGRNRRSINSEILLILDEATAPRSVNVDAILVRARTLRGLTHGTRLDQDFIDRAKREGRP